MSIFKTRSNKKFDYTPRYYKGEGNPYEIKHKFDEHRQTVGSNKGIKTKINLALFDYKYNQNKGANKRVFLIVFILLFIFLFLIGFDLSFFTKN